MSMQGVLVFSRLSARKTALSSCRYLQTSLQLLLVKKGFSVGDKAELSRAFSPEEVLQFAKLTGDTNPLHLSAKFAQGTRFRKPIVHGVLLNGLISAVHGTKLPGPGCVVLSQQFRYPSPLYPGDMVTACVEVISFRHSVMTCLTTCTAVDRNELVLTGETKLLVPAK